MAFAIPEATAALRELKTINDDLTRMRKSIGEINRLLEEQNDILRELVKWTNVVKESEKGEANEEQS